MSQVTRRDALVGLSSAAMMSWGYAIHARLQARAGEPVSTLAADQRTLIAQLAEIIIPQTGTPGATAAGVPAFIELVLAEWCPAGERDAILSGLSELGPFVDVQHVQILEDARARWFERFKFFTVWGYYTSRAGFSEELKGELMPGRYDGNAPYAR